MIRRRTIVAASHTVHMARILLQALTINNAIIALRIKLDLSTRSNHGRTCFKAPDAYYTILLTAVPCSRVPLDVLGRFLKLQQYILISIVLYSHSSSAIPLLFT